jgi:hypothetical protein
MTDVPLIQSQVSDHLIGNDDVLWVHRINAKKDIPSADVGSLGRDEFLPISVVPERVERFGHARDTSSISINHSSGRVAMTWLSGSNHSGIGITPLSNSEGENHIGKSVTHNIKPTCIVFLQLRLAGLCSLTLVS